MGNGPETLEENSISAHALGENSSFAKKMLPPVLGVSSLVLASCAQGIETATITTQEAFTTSVASQALEQWMSFTNGSQKGEIVGTPYLLANPDDANGADMWSFHPANPDGTPNKDVDYGFAKAFATLDGQSQVYSVTFILKHVESTKTTTAYLLLLDKDTPTQKTYAVSEIGTDGISHLAPFSFVMDLNPTDPTKDSFTLQPNGSADAPLAATAQPVGAAAKVYEAVFKIDGSNSNGASIPLTATPDTGATVTPTTAPTKESSPTVDPNMPEGATGKDAQGNWIKPLLDTSGKPVVENGTPLYEKWVSVHFAGDLENVTGHWFGPHGTTPLIEHCNSSDSLKSDYLNLQFELSDGISGPNIIQVHDDSQGELSGPTLASLIYSALGTRYLADHSGQTGVDFYNAFKSSDGISYPFDTSDGSFVYNNKTGKIIVRGVDLQTAQNDPRFWKRNFGSINQQIYTMTTGDKTGDAISYIASTIPFASMTRQQIQQAVLMSFAEIISGKDTPVTHEPYGKFMNNWSFFADSADKGAHPVIEISTTP